MKKILLQILLIFVPIINYGQDSISTSKVEKSFVLSIGSGFANYYNSNFFDNVLLSSLYTPVGYNSVLTDYFKGYVINGSIGPAKKIRPIEQSPFINLSFSMELKKRVNKKTYLNHIIETNFLLHSSNSNYELAYTLKQDSSPIDYHDVVDTNSLHSNNFMYAIGYKFQPTYKIFFLSLGAFATINEVQTRRNTIEYVHAYWYDSQSIVHDNYYESQIVTTMSYKFYVSGLLQIGAGAYLKIKNLTLKPSFYFISDRKSGVNFNNLSLGVIYKLKA